LTNLQIDQANLGATGQVSIDINVTTAATQAQVDVENIPVAVAPVAASTATPVTITNAEVQSDHTVTFGTAVDLDLLALNGGSADASAGNSFSGITIVDGAVAGTSYNATNGVLTVTVDITGGDNTVADLAAAIDAGTDFNATLNAGGAEAIVAGAVTLTTNTQNVQGRDAGSATISVSATTTGTAFNGRTVTIQEAASVGATPQVALDVNGNIVVTVDDTVTTTLQAISDAIDGLSDFSAELTVASGDGNYIGNGQTPPAVQSLTGGVNGSGGLSEDAVIELSGADGAEVFNLKAGTSISELVSQINLVKDATGVEASANGTTLELKSTAFGSNAFVDLKVVTELSTGTFTGEVGSGARAEGADVVATVNGISANGDGNTLSINTATLDLTASVEASFVGTIEFDITGGGALFQLGPDVVSNQQARLGITSVNTSRLGGVSGKLFQLASGGTADLTTDLNNAADIVGEAINQITSLRGRLGAFQRTTLETNKNALNDTLINLTEAESQIRDADFAAESAELTRAQILVQAGTTVLQIANSNPQNVLALLR
jgi:flagellin